MTSLLRLVDGGVPELNYLSREWVDPVIGGLLHLFGQGESVLLYVALQHLLSLVGLVSLFRARSMTRSESCWGALGVQAAVIFVCGFHPILYKMQWYPFLLAWAFKKRTEYIEGKTASVTFWGTARDLLLFGVWILSSGGLSLLGFLPLMFIVPAYTPFFLALSGAALWILPVFPLIGYPPNDRLGPITPLDFESAPLLGPKLSPNPLSYGALQLTLWQCLLRLWLVGGVLSVWAWGKGKRGLGLTLLALFFCLGAGAAAELFFPSSFSLTPVRVLYRIIPGAALHPLPWLVFPFLLPFLWIAAGRELFRATAISLIVMVVAFFVRGANSGGLFPVIQADAEIGRAWGLGAVPSPSQFVRSLYSEGALRAAQQQARLLVPGRDFQWTLSSSHRSQEIALAGDGDIKTAWSTGEPQQGSEWIEVEFDRPVAVVRIELAVGGLQSDFPRGVVVRAVETGSELFSQQNWSGALRFTPSHEPYLGPQAEVVLPLEQHPPVKKLRIEQVGQERFFNWSIAEIRVYTSSS